MQQVLQNNNCLSDNSQKKLFGMPDKYDYSKYSSLNEFGWDNELMNKFLPIAQKLNLSQESLDMLLDLALEMSKKQKNEYEKDETIKLQDKVAGFSKLFDEDKEIPSSNSVQLREYMNVADDAYNKFCSPKLKQILQSSGLIYHPELIKMFYKIGELIKEDTLFHSGKPVVEELTPAQILYGTKE